MGGGGAGTLFSTDYFPFEYYAYIIINGSLSWSFDQFLLSFSPFFSPSFHDIHRVATLDPLSDTTYYCESHGLAGMSVFFVLFCFVFSIQGLLQLFSNFPYFKKPGFCTFILLIVLNAYCVLLANCFSEHTTAGRVHNKNVEKQ